MIFPCPNKIDCPGTDDPIMNLSSEMEDAIEYIGTINPPIIPPPLGQIWKRDGCLFQCVSIVSQEEADACAERQAEFCITCVENCEPPVDPPPDHPDDWDGILRYSTRQCCSVSCPDGTLFTYCVAAGRYVGYSQNVVNAQAYSLACKNAKLYRICLGALSKTCGCVGIDFTATVNTTPKPLWWSIASGSLPDGLSIESAYTATGQCRISGIPSAHGTFTFTLVGVDVAGNYMAKSFSITILEIDNITPDPFTIGVAYLWVFTTSGGSGIPNYRYSIVDGTLPAGLTMDEYGRITGTPTEGGDHTFTVAVVDINLCPT